MERLEEHPLVESASCLKVRTSKEETRQVFVLLGEPPAELDLGIFGTFSLGEYYREPLRCTKYQRFDHHVTKCRSKPHCGVCSEEHLTDVCIQKLKDSILPKAKCPSCGLEHHAWNPICEERHKRPEIPPGL